MSAMSIRLLKFFHPQDEKDRMDFRMCIKRAMAEEEDLHRTLNGHMKGHAAPKTEDSWTLLGGGVCEGKPEPRD